MWKSLSVEDQEQRSAVCLWVCVCDYCSICELIRSRMSITRELLQFGVVEVHTAQCTTDTSTHTVGGNCTESWPQHISSRLSSECLFNTYLEHFFVQCSWRCTLTPPCLCFIFYFILEHWVDFLSDVHWLRHARPTYWELLVTLNFIHFLSFSPSRTPDLQEFYLQLSFHL